MLDLLSKIFSQTAAFVASADARNGDDIQWLMGHEDIHHRVEHRMRGDFEASNVRLHSSRGENAGRLCIPYTFVQWWHGVLRE